MANVYIDSNVFFYAKIMDGIFGESCSGVLSSITLGRTKASISALVPLEVANALAKYGLADEVHAEIQAIFSMGIEVLSLDGPDIREVAEVFGDTEVSPYDCTHAVLMRKHGLKEIISADKDFEKFGWVKRIDPRSFRPDKTGAQQNLA